MITEVRIRAFRATDDELACTRFIDGHKKVLENHGINKVTSSNSDWMTSPSVFVVVVETLDGERMFGGARMHAANGVLPLPIEDAVGDMDGSIYTIVRTLRAKGTGELCGLWNSMEVAGMGIGSIFASRAAIAMSSQIGLDSLFSLCSPLTLKFCEWEGARVLTGLGNQGTFYYPKINLIATVAHIADNVNLPDSEKHERERLFSLRQNPKQVIREKSPIGRNPPEIIIHYDLLIPNADVNEFKIP
jgi:hypothetical protein